MAYAAAAGTDVALALLRRTRRRQVSKTALMPALAVAVPPRSLAPALGLAGSWAGDVALLRSDDRSFLVGLGSFSAAHLAYTAGFAARGGRPRPAHALPIAAATAATGAVLGRHAGELRAPVHGYALLIGAMAVAATGVRGPGSGRILGGALTFALSDTLLALDRFVLGERWSQAADGGVMLSYTLAQWLIHDGLHRHDRAGS
nr:lysoplasmalogenase [Saccharopolyspora sp. HNM0983]